MTALSTELPSLPALPALRLLPAPSHQPPYDDELPVAPVLRLVAPPLVAPPLVAPPLVTPPLVTPPLVTPPLVAPPLVTPPLVVPPSLRVLPTPAGEAGDLDVELWLAARRTPTAELPAALPFARALVQGLLEVLAGVRPLRQLQRDTTPELYAVLERAVSRQRAPAGPRPGGRAVRSVHVQEHPEGVVEVCATVQRGLHAGALALRLEGLDGRWRCTELVGV